MTTELLLLTLLTAGPPQAISVSPSAGSGSSQTFTFVFTDPDGASLRLMLFQDDTHRWSRSCGLSHSVARGFRLLNDDNSAWLTQRLENSQCSINLSSTTAVYLGSQVKLSVPIVFKPVFSGAKSIYLETYGPGGGWAMKSFGSWTVAACPVCPQCPDQRMEIWTDRIAVRCAVCKASVAVTTWVPRGPVEVLRNGLRLGASDYSTIRFPLDSRAPPSGQVAVQFPAPVPSGTLIELRYPVPAGTGYAVLGLNPLAFLRENVP